MKRFTSLLASKAIATLVLLVVFQTYSLAQDEGAGSSSTVTKTTTTTTSTWYAEPWVWVVGAAVFILLLVALLRGNSSGSERTDRVTVTKTTSRDSDV